MFAVGRLRPSWVRREVNWVWRVEYWVTRDQAVTACWNIKVAGPATVNTGREAPGSSWVFLLLLFSLSCRLGSWVTQASTITELLSWQRAVYSVTVWRTTTARTWNIWVLERMERY